MEETKMADDDNLGTTYKHGASANSPPPVPKKRGRFNDPSKRKNREKGSGRGLKLTAALVLAGGLFAGGIFAADYVRDAYVKINNAIYRATHTNPSEARVDYNKSLKNYDTSIDEFAGSITGVVQDAAKYASPTQLEKMTKTTYGSMSQQQQTQFVSTAAQDIGMVCTTTK
jgi:hypothetical protein